MCIFEVGELGGRSESRTGEVSCFMKYLGGSRGGRYECFTGGSCERAGGG